MFNIVWCAETCWYDMNGAHAQARSSLCSGEMVRQARILAQATSDLVNAIKADAEGETDLENSRKLLSAAKLLADATAKMVEAAKVGQSCALRLDSCKFVAECCCVCAGRVRLLTPTARSSSRSCVKLPRVCAWPPTPRHRMPSKRGWSTNWRWGLKRTNPNLQELKYKMTFFWGLFWK